MGHIKIHNINEYLFCKIGIYRITHFKNKQGCRLDLQVQNKLVVCPAVNKCNSQEQSFYLKFNLTAFLVLKEDQKQGILTLYYSCSTVNAALLSSLELFEREIEHSAYNSLL